MTFGHLLVSRYSYQTVSHSRPEWSKPLIENAVVVGQMLLYKSVLQSL